jgi:hypothetical protein
LSFETIALESLVIFYIVDVCVVSPGSKFTRSLLTKEKPVDDWIAQYSEAMDGIEAMYHLGKSDFFFFSFIPNGSPVYLCILRGAGYL